MKKLKIAIITSLSIAIVLSGASCKKSFFSDANTNPNSPDSASIIPSVMLSTVEGALAYVQGGDLSRFSSLITQQTFGDARQAQGYYGYTFTSVDFDNVWGNLYTSVMKNNQTLMQISDAKADNHYGAISRILMAYTLQLTVDSWGSVPYSQAFKAPASLQSTYDTDKGLYDTVFSLLNIAIAKLSGPSGFDKPGGEDVLYGGTVSKWIKFAHAIKARLYIHQAKGNAAMANNALAEIALSFTSNADNAKYIFGTSDNAAAPWYQFNSQRTGDIAYATSTLANKMLATGDPRFDVFIDSSFNDVNGVGLGEYYGEINSPVEFITYDELMFMKAEATLISTGNLVTAQIAFQAAIQANMNKLGVDGGDAATYIAANGTLAGTTAAAIAKVSAEEYIALYLNPEAWALWRRNNSPALTPVVGSNVPRRWLYPQTEYSYNGDNVPGSTTLFSAKVFWDK
ncbi:MAG TPA: SusD/RagB family nutrient-binding outer membrane lipoprotein [Chitinophagaceae bacterium]|nr:SusD/RagB family nutrient-binding outer membrane lipoprotein [Chitinophagaceae bacterium]